MLSLDLLAEVTLGKLDVVLSGTVLGHEVEETVVDVDLNYGGRMSVGSIEGSEYGTDELVFVTEDVGDVHVVGRGGDILLLTRRWDEIDI